MLALPSRKPALARGKGPVARGCLGAVASDENSSIFRGHGDGHECGNAQQRLPKALGISALFAPRFRVRTLLVSLRSGRRALHLVPAATAADRDAALVVERNELETSVAEAAWR
jgi:hypothetical protein